MFVVIIFSFVLSIKLLNGSSRNFEEQFSNSRASSYSQNSSEPTTKMYFVVQTGWSNYKTELDSDDLQGDFYIEDKWKSDIQKLYNINIKSLQSANYYEEYKKLPQDSLIFVPYYASDYRLKTIDINGINFWRDFSKLEEYPIALDIDMNQSIVFDPDKILTYVAAGEMIPARDVLNRKREVGYDYKYNLANLKELFRNADVSSAILENPIAGHPTPDCHYGCFTFIGDEDFKMSLSDAGIDVLSFGNHIGDKGKQAIADTLKNLDEVQVSHTGLSLTSQTDASSPVQKEIKEVTFGFIGYDDVAYYYWAGENNYGTARYSYRDANGVQYTDFDKLQSDIENIASKVDVLVAIVSWGEREYVNYASERQQEVGHFMIDHGVDIVVGSHQHWVNEIEFYNAKPIFYGLGNTLFDQTHTEETRQGALVKFYIYNGDLVSFDYIPIITWGYHQITQISQMVSKGDIVTPYNLYQPYLLEKTDPAYDQVFNRMLQNSDI